MPESPRCRAGNQNVPCQAANSRGPAHSQGLSAPARMRICPAHGGIEPGITASELRPYCCPTAPCPARDAAACHLGVLLQRPRPSFPPRGTATSCPAHALTSASWKVGNRDLKSCWEIWKLRDFGLHEISRPRRVTNKMAKWRMRRVLGGRAGVLLGTQIKNYVYHNPSRPLLSTV